MFSVDLIIVFSVSFSFLCRFHCISPSPWINWVAFFCFLSPGCFSFLNTLRVPCITVIRRTSTEVKRDGLAGCVDGTQAGGGADVLAGKDLVLADARCLLAANPRSSYLGIKTKLSQKHGIAMFNAAKGEVQALLEASPLPPGGQLHLAS